MSQKRPISMDNEMHALISFDTRLSVQASHKKDTSVAQQSLISYSCPKYNGTCCPDYFPISSINKRQTRVLEIQHQKQTDFLEIQHRKQQSIIIL